MDRTATGTTSSSNPTTPTGAGSEFRSFVAGTSMERRPKAHARIAQA